MKARVKILIFSLFIAPSICWGIGFHNVINTSLGLVNASINETIAPIESTDPTVSVPESEPAATSASVTSFELNYEFLQKTKRSFFIKSIVPLLSADGSGVFLGGVGVNFYLNPLSTVYSYETGGTTMIMMPKLKYYWGASTGIGYLVYNTESAKKSDVFFDLSLHAGGGYQFSRNWGMRGELSFGRGTGSATTSISTRVFVGASYSI